jgi:hypothetical protein
MSASATIGTAVLPREDAEKGHRTRLFLAWMLALAVVLVIAGYGMNYYTLSAAQRPFSPKHQLLRPSGTIGIKLGMVGVLMFFLIYLYPLRKNGEFPALARFSRGPRHGRAHHHCISFLVQIRQHRRHGLL